MTHNDEFRGQQREDRSMTKDTTTEGRSAVAGPLQRPVGRLEPEHAIAGMPRTEYLLRRLLAHRVAGPRGYYDDGELQDNTRAPFIDYLRDHPKDIELKLMERNKTPNAKLTGAQRPQENDR